MGTLCYRIFKHTYRLLEHQKPFLAEVKCGNLVWSRDLVRHCLKLFFGVLGGWSTLRWPEEELVYECEG